MSTGTSALTGAVSGAGAGAALGPWGALAGGVLGGLGSYLTAQEAEKAAKEALAREEEQRKQQMLMKAAEIRYEPYTKMAPTTQVSNVEYSPINKPGLGSVIGGGMSGASFGLGLADKLSGAGAQPTAQQAQQAAPTGSWEAMLNRTSGDIASLSMPEERTSASWNRLLEKPTLYKRKDME